MDIRNYIKFALSAIIFVVYLAAPVLCRAEIIDRVIGYVDDRAITYSEFRERHEKLRKISPGITEEEALISMVNALLLLHVAKKMRLEAPTEDGLIKEYVDVTIRSRISLKEEQLLEYYNKNRAEFKGMEFPAVRAEIEKYLTELEINKQLKEHLKLLRQRANIVIQLKIKDR